jgi:hypothetical protein
MRGRGREPRWRCETRRRDRSPVSARRPPPTERRLTVPSHVPLRQPAVVPSRPPRYPAGERDCTSERPGRRRVGGGEGDRTACRRNESAAARDRPETAQAPRAAAELLHAAFPERPHQCPVIASSSGCTAVEVPYALSAGRPGPSDTAIIDFRNAAEVEARLLCTVVPSGLEKYFAEFGDPVPTRTSPAPELSDAEREERVRTAISTAPEHGMGSSRRRPALRASSDDDGAERRIGAGSSACGRAPVRAAGRASRRHRRRAARRACG